MEPKVGGEIKIQYDTTKAQASIDYTRPDKLVFTVQGEQSLKVIGLPDVTVGGGVKIDGQGATYSGTVQWEISADVAAKVDLQHAPSGSSAMMTLSVKF
ncbi:MAG TPA: hypothetical protein VHW23_13545 [Kofleriaceae bacterium]|nr:hypothetical protein [Kofleriaceae bacterium]